MTLAAIRFTIAALLSFNLFVNAYKYIEMASPVTTVEQHEAGQVTLYQCTLTAGITQRQTLFFYLCDTLASEIDKNVVYASVNFYRTWAPKYIIPDARIIIDGLFQLGPNLPHLTVGDEFPRPMGPTKGSIFEMFAHTNDLERLKSLLTKHLTPYFPQGMDVPTRDMLISKTLNYYGLNDMKAFTDTPDVAKDYMEGFVTVLKYILQATVNAKSNHRRRLPKLLRFGSIGRKKPQPTEKRNGEGTTDAVRNSQNLQDATFILVQKMFDPCVVLNFVPRSKDATKINEYCNIYCKFLGLVARTSSLQDPPECVDLQRGACNRNKLCICRRKRPALLEKAMKWKPDPRTKMLFCNNKIRLKALLDPPKL
nr:PREDICTED: uncharacterized protein LOC109044074 isoform X1 [Bemisia tabaci]XP_018917123.1 PREDICTED: uncharacterized protein LOC109044074 isoform X1 [Bemisia tabaci]